MAFQPMYPGKLGLNTKKPLISPQTRPQSGMELTTSSGQQIGNSPNFKTSLSLKEDSSMQKRSRKKTKTKTSNPNPKPGLNINVEIGNRDDDRGFRMNAGRTPYYDESMSSEVKFGTDLGNTLHVNELGNPTSSSTLRIENSMAINLATYASLFGYPDTVTGQYFPIIFNRYSKVIKAKIRSKIVDSFTETNFKGYISALIEALEIFYTIDSIMAYKSTEGQRDKNKSILAIQDYYDDNDILTRQNTLRKLLKGYWFPPEFSQLIRWTFQNYKTSELEQSQNIRFIPRAELIWTSSGTFNKVGLIGHYDALIQVLQSDTYANIASIIGDVYPEGTIAALPQSCNRSVYNADFAEVFRNQPCNYADESGSYRYYPNNNGESDADVFYCVDRYPSQTNGWPFAMQTIYQDANGNPAYNFLLPFRMTSTAHEDETNKLASSFSGGEIIWSARGTWPRASGLDVFQTNRVTAGTDEEYTITPAGWQRVYFDNRTAPGILAKDFLDYLFGLNW